MSTATSSATMPPAASSTAGPWRPMRQKSEARSRRRPAATVSSGAMEESRTAGLELVLLLGGHSLSPRPCAGVSCSRCGAEEGRQVRPADWLRRGHEDPIQLVPAVSHRADGRRSDVIKMMKEKRSFVKLFFFIIIILFMRHHICLCLCFTLLAQENTVDKNLRHFAPTNKPHDATDVRN